VLDRCSTLSGPEARGWSGCSLPTLRRVQTSRRASVLSCRVDERRLLASHTSLPFGSLNGVGCRAKMLPSCHTRTCLPIGSDNARAAPHRRCLTGPTGRDGVWADGRLPPRRCVRRRRASPTHRDPHGDPVGVSQKRYHRFAGHQSRLDLTLN